MNQHRDSLASYIGHPNLTEFFAIAENESKARIKFNFLQVSLSPLYYYHTGGTLFVLMMIGESVVKYVVVSKRNRNYVPYRKCCSHVVFRLKSLKMTKLS